MKKYNIVTVNEVKHAKNAHKEIETTEEKKDLSCIAATYSSLQVAYYPFLATDDISHCFSRKKG